MMSFAALKFLILCAFFEYTLAMASTDGLLPNGNFSKGPRSSALRGTEIIGNLPGWQTSGFVEYIKAGHTQNDMLVVVPEGEAAVRLGNEAFIKKRIKVTKGSFYCITFSVVRTCAQAEQLNVSVSPESDLMPVQTIYDSTGWGSYSWGFQAKFSRVDLVIHNPGTDEDPACGPLIDSVAIQTLNPPPLTKSNLIKNGDFEEGPYLFENTSWGVLIPPMMEDDHSPLPAWMVLSLKAVKYIDSMHYSVPKGTRAVELVAGKESVLAQIVRTVPGKAYSLTFSIGDGADGCIGPMTVEVYAARQIFKISYESKGSGGSNRATMSFVAVDTRSRVVFLSSYYHMKFDGSMCGPVIDDVVLVNLHNA